MHHFVNKSAYFIWQSLELYFTVYKNGSLHLFSVLSFREKWIKILQLWAQTTESSTGCFDRILCGCNHIWQKKQNPQSDTRQNGRAPEPIKSCSGAKLVENVEMVHGRELGIVYSKIESSKAKQTREMWTTSHKNQDKCKWGTESSARAHPQYLHPQATWN